MGKYINKTSTGIELDARGKVEDLVNDGATIVKPEWQPNLICVVDNGPFEAAAYAYSESEFDAFNDASDFRTRTWLVHPLAEHLAE